MFQEPDPIKSQRVTGESMQMTKLDIECLQVAYKGTGLRTLQESY